MPQERLAIITQTEQLSEPSPGGVITDPEELLALLELDRSLLAGARKAGALFPLRVPYSFARRMRKGDPDDPLLRQVLGGAEETNSAPGFSQDPLDEQAFSPVPGVLHKYAGRVLLMASNVCGVHCRYCFRRHFPYQEHSLPGAGLEQAMAWLREQKDVDEVILSGGDPLVLSERRLIKLVSELSHLPWLRRIRIHTRQPVVMPESVTTGLVEALAAVPQSVVVVIHANHPQELDETVGRALAPLREAGITLLNQSVLLAGVNDDEEVLAALSESLFQVGVMPYYLHLLDPVAGAAHFQVDPGAAKHLHRGLRARIPGYLVPRLVREVPGEPAKSPVPLD